MIVLIASTTVIVLIIGVTPEYRGWYLKTEKHHWQGEYMHEAKKYDSINMPKNDCVCSDVSPVH